MRTPFLAGCIDRGFCIGQGLGHFSKWSFSNMETFGDFASDLSDLHDPEIEFL